MLAQIRSVAEAHSGAVCPSLSGVRHGTAYTKSMAMSARATQTRSLATKVVGAAVRPKSKMSAGVRAKGVMSVRETQKQILRREDARAYSTSESGAGDASNGAKQESDSSASAAASPAAGASVKKSTGTSSTLSNLENLYAAFAKQQKEKAKPTDEVAKPKRGTVPPVAANTERHASDRFSFDDDPPIPTDAHERQAFYRSAAAQIDAVEAYVQHDEWDIPTGQRGIERRPTEADDEDEELPGNVVDRFLSDTDVQDVKLGRTLRSNRYRPSTDDLGIAIHRRTGGSLEDPDSELSHYAGLGEGAEEEERELLEEGEEYLDEEGDDGEYYSSPRTFADLRAIEEERAIAAGELDPTSPYALEMKKRNQVINPRSDNEAQAIEQTLIARHRAAVEQVAHVERDLDISATVSGMAPLTHAQNPYLYNEAYGVGLTASELEWLSGRDSWQALVSAKRTNIALQQRDMKEDRDLVDKLFIKVVNQLTDGPTSAGYIHPEDLKAQHAALEARKRLQTRLWEIYNNSELQWATLLHKYLPTPVEDGLAHNAMDREFWTPSNPWLLTAFTKQLVEEAEYMDKMISNDDMEEEITDRLVEQGHIRDDMYSDNYAVGPLGQSSGISSEEEVENQEAADSKSQHMGCLFCSTHRHRFPLEPMNVPLLARHMTTSGTILPRAATGLCKRHQAKMSRTIKQARHMNLFTYKKSLYRINNVYKSVDTWTTPDLNEVVYKTPEDIKPPTSQSELYDAELDFENRHEMTMEEAYNFGASPVDAHAKGHYAHLDAETEHEQSLMDIEADGQEEEEITERLNEGMIDHAVIASIEAYAARQAAEHARRVAEGLEDADSQPTIIMDPKIAAASNAAAAAAAAKQQDTRGLPREMRLRALDKQTQQFNKNQGKRSPGASANLNAFDDDNDSVGNDMINRALSKGSKGNSRQGRAKRDSL